MLECSTLIGDASFDELVAIVHTPALRHQGHLSLNEDVVHIVCWLLTESELSDELLLTTGGEID